MKRSRLTRRTDATPRLDAAAAALGTGAEGAPLSPPTQTTLQIAGTLQLRTARRALPWQGAVPAPGLPAACAGLAALGPTSPPLPLGLQATGQVVARLLLLKGTCSTWIAAADVPCCRRHERRPG